MVYERPGRGHSSPGYSYSGRNYHREKTPEEKEQERVKEQKRLEREALEQAALQSTLEMSDSAEKLVAGRVVNQQQVWQEFLLLVSDKYGTKVARILATNTSEGKVSIGDLVSKEVPQDVAVEIYQDWDSLWQESVNNVAQSDEAQINQVFQAGIPTAIVGTYGTTVGTKVIWRTFGAVIAQRFGAVAAQALGLSAADGLLPVGEAVAAGLLMATAIRIAKNWDKLWAETEKILVQQEPEPQIYTTPDGETGTIENTGHAPPEVETGTPGYESPSVDVPPHTGHDELEQPSAEDFIMESQLDQDFKNPEVRRRDEIAHGGYYTRKNLRKKFQEAELSPRDKHISSTTVEEAERKSYNVAQYLPGINHGALEPKAMLEGEYLMERPGDGYWNFYRSDDYVGYDKGVKTRWIRSEYSANTIHGHPMNPKRVSKYIKNPKL